MEVWSKVRSRWRCAAWTPDREDTQTLEHEMTNRGETTRGTTYRNVVLTAICGLLAIIALRDPASVGASEAVAAQPMNVPNAFAQRLQIIDELKELKAITSKLTSMEKTIDSRLASMESQLVEQSAAMKLEQQKRRGKEGNDE
jgi:hypothetical protein